MDGQRVAIVTGAATGIGAATATALAANGVHVVVNHLGASDKAAAEQTASACTAAGAEARLCQADVSQEADRYRLVEVPLQEWGRIDYLVNNAGASAGRSLADLDGATVEEFHFVYDVNVVAPFMLSRAVAKPMRKQGSGAIVNVASIAGLTGMGSSYPYLVTKAALINLTLALARIMGPEIRVNAVCPGMVNTAWPQREMGLERFESVTRNIIATSPLRSIVEPDDVAGMIIWLLTSARKMTGEVLRMDSGVHLGPGI